MFGRKEEETPDAEYFTIFDTKVGVYRDPILAVNRNEVVRSLVNFMANPQNQTDPLCCNAEDFQLFKVGFYFRRGGILQGVKPEHIANLHELRSLAMQRMSSGSDPVGIAST